MAPSGEKKRVRFFIVGYDAVNLMVNIPSFAFCYAAKDILLHNNNNSKKGKKLQFSIRDITLT